MNTICPNCNNNITCPDHYVGKPCICPHCQHSFTAIPTVISQTAPNSKKGKEKASEQESALSLATGTAKRGIIEWYYVVVHLVYRLKVLVCFGCVLLSVAS
ncbi:hypothetical protein [uncultured Akkermansia sp.]|uniref:hypothetical protein n=1 Tax=uncultured Akkermansia sp. TaxID=512294 RepID=UPI00263915A8|nr:hypothetical protein [uncultured Akkermansia sp.]